MFRLHPVHFKQPFIPPLFAFARVVEKGGECRVCRSDELSGTARHKIVIDVQPFVDFCEYLRLVVFDPLVLPYRIFDADRTRVIHAQVSKELVQTAAGHLDDSFSHTIPEFAYAPAVHIVHRRTKGLTVRINKDHTLHLCAESEAGYIFRSDIRSHEQFFCRIADRPPPFLRILLGTAIFKYIEPIGRT